MKIILVEEANDRYYAVVAVAQMIARLKQTIKLRYSLYLVTERKNAWELAAGVGFNGVIKKPCLKTELFDKIINEETASDGKADA